MTTKRITTTALTVLALAGLLGACGGGGGGDDEAGPARLDDTTTTEAAGDGGGEMSEEDAALEYAQCMRDHGIDMPDPQVNEEGEATMELPGVEGMSTEAIQAAEEECRPLLDQARSEGDRPSPEELAERQDQAVALAECMRGKGWDMPDPQIEEGGGIAIENPEGLGGPGDPEFDRFQEDMEACHEEAGIPTPGEGGDSGLNTETDG
jgi:hypothetical protein